MTTRRLFAPLIHNSSKKYIFSNIFINRRHTTTQFLVNQNISNNQKFHFTTRAYKHSEALIYQKELNKHLEELLKQQKYSRVEQEFNKAHKKHQLSLFTYNLYFKALAEQGKV